MSPLSKNIFSTEELIVCILSQIIKSTDSLNITLVALENMLLLQPFDAKHEFVSSHVTIFYDDQLQRDSAKLDPR